MPLFFERQASRVNAIKRRPFWLPTAAALLAITLTASQLCAAEQPDPDNVVMVTTAEELVTALSRPGQHIRMQRGNYDIEAPLMVPDGTTLQGEGVMRMENGLPVGFEPGTETTIRVIVGFEGDLLTLGDGTFLRGLRFQDLEENRETPRVGNVIVAGSRAPGDNVSAVIQECEIISPNDGGVGPEGPTGHALVVFTRNPGRNLEPPPHAGARINARLERSIVRANGNALFSINFASDSALAITLEHNRIQGTVGAAAGVSRPDEVSGSSVTIASRGNFYTPHPGGYDVVGLSVMGGSSSHIPNLGAPGAHHNVARVNSEHDRIEGFKAGIRAIGGRRWLDASGAISDNRVELDVQNTQILTAEATGVDLVLEGTFSEVAPETGQEFSAGDRNVVEVRMRNVAGSPTPRQNVFANVTGPVLEANLGVGNRLEFAGTVEQFTRSNPGITTAPAAEFFREEAELDNP